MDKDLVNIKKELQKRADPNKVTLYLRYFKCGVGEYGEGDIFIGVTVPKTREVVKMFTNSSLTTIKNLLSSKRHEERMTALLILTKQFPKANEEKRKRIFSLYLSNTRYINNWDLVDLSAPKIVGAYLENKSKERKILYKLAKSPSVWERRIAILSTAYFISKNKFADTLKISNILIKDKHDLIHKGVGWMLREVGKRDRRTEEEFLKKHYLVMPRTMLRYAIEKFPEGLRKNYLGK